jgi:hypothetical protein
VRLFDVSAEDGQTVRTIKVRDDQGPRHAARAYAKQYDTGDAVLLVSAFERGAKVTRWRVEPVTTYRARPA